MKNIFTLMVAFLFAVKGFCYNTSGCALHVDQAYFFHQNLIKLTWKGDILEYDFVQNQYRLRLDFAFIGFQGSQGICYLASAIQNIGHNFTPDITGSQFANPQTITNFPALGLYFSSLQSTWPDSKHGVKALANNTTYPKFSRVFENVDNLGYSAKNIYTRDNIIQPSVNFPVSVKWTITKTGTVANPTENLSKDLNGNWVPLTGTFVIWNVEVQLNGEVYNVAEYYLPIEYGEYLLAGDPLHFAQEHFGGAEMLLNSQKTNVRFSEMKAWDGTNWYSLDKWKITYRIDDGNNNLDNRFGWKRDGCSLVSVCGHEDDILTASRDINTAFDLGGMPAPSIMQNWTQKNNLQATTTSNMSFSANGKGYLLMRLSGNFFEFDPVNNLWTPKASFPGTHRELAVGFSIGIKGYIGTGLQSDETMLKDFWEYDIVANTWSQKTDFPGTARQVAVGFSIGNKGYIGTGYDGNLKNDFWQYDPSTNAWTQKANFGGGIRAAASGFAIGSKGYIGTGTSALDNSGLSNDFWEYDPSTNTWTQKANISGSVRVNAVGFSIGTKGYLGTGSGDMEGGGGPYYKDFWEYDPACNAWVSVSDYPGSGSFNLIGFSIGATAYVGGGEGGAIYGDFWNLNTANTALPVRWGTINATLRNTDVLVVWNTLMEENTSYYEVEANYGNGFEKIARLASENKPNGSHYNFPDKVALEYQGKQILYRIRQVDLNGKYSYSNIVSIKIPDGIQILVLQGNPVKTDIQCKFISSASQIISIRILNLAGQILYNENLSVVKGTNKIVIPVSAYPGGLYILSISDKLNSYTEKFIRQ